MNLPSQNPENRLTSEKYAEFTEAVDILYIKNNISGRNIFTAAWPDAALHIFGEELIRFDREGSLDKERRAKLEEEAEDRRVALMEIIEVLEKKSVSEGALQIEYVQGIVQQLGRKLALNMYSRWLVDRFIPPSPGESVAVQPNNNVPDMKPPENIGPIDVSQPAGDAMDKIRPISVEQDMSPPPEPDPIPEPPRQAASLPQQDDGVFRQSAVHRVEEEDEAASPPLFVAGQPPAPTPVTPIATPPESELIVETQGTAETTLGAATQQESMAPVMGAPKKAGLKIMSISDSEEPPKTGENNQ